MVLQPNMWEHHLPTIRILVYHLPTLVYPKSMRSLIAEPKNLYTSVNLLQHSSLPAPRSRTEPKAFFFFTTSSVTLILQKLNQIAQQLCSYSYFYRMRAQGVISISVEIYRYHRNQLSRFRDYDILVTEDTVSWRNVSERFEMTRFHRFCLVGSLKKCF